MKTEATSQRKTDHIDLAFRSQVTENDQRFYYEPLLSSHPNEWEPSIPFLKKHLKAPLWVSSMTGGSEKAGLINERLARMCGNLGLGMGLGSCRIILEDNTFLKDFQLRKHLGDEVPFFANLGIAQVEELLSRKKISLILDLIDKTETDGLIVHVNPLQEWLQPEGDKIRIAPLQTIISLLDKIDLPVIVKEVGQGMGPESLEELLKLPLAAIDFGAFGGTNFSRLEMLRNENKDQNVFESLAFVGHTADQMVEYCNVLIDSNPAYINKEFIISGGVRDFLDGYYLSQKLKATSIYAHASLFLKYAEKGQDELMEFAEAQIRGYRLASRFLKVV
ncbi:MAG: type 2 isopentenyl-diphosphate Delta-isomerase [Bacteroidetes bacterium]|nr:type 2 isopentenyl-diphosphate Delta-isomerase [Bacteroidota bacterium]